MRAPPSGPGPHRASPPVLPGWLPPQAHIARRLAASHGLGDDDVIIDRQRLEELQSAVYCLQAAIEDVDRDLADAPDDEERRRALAWLLDNARPVAAIWIEPRTEPIT